MKVIAFSGSRRIAAGLVEDVALEVKHQGGNVLVFNAETSRPVELDLRGSDAEILDRLHPAEVPRKPGRPKLGVVAREVTLLPRHWEWLNAQPGGASVALRKLVEEARRVKAPEDRRREAQEATYRFISVLAGNEPGFEEALRALYGNDREHFEMYSAAWPVDVREHARELAATAFSAD
jgi:hypothetical protein